MEFYYFEDCTEGPANKVFTTHSSHYVCLFGLHFTILASLVIQAAPLGQQFLSPLPTPSSHGLASSHGHSGLSQIPLFRSSLFTHIKHQGPNM